MYIHVGAMNIKLCMSISHKSSLKLQSTKSLLCAVGLRRDKLWCSVASFQAFPIQVLYLSACGTRIVAYKNGEGLGVSIIVGGAIGKALLLFPEAGSPLHLVEELLASHIICTTCGMLAADLIWRPLCEATPICESTLSLPSRDTYAQAFHVLKSHYLDTACA